MKVFTSQPFEVIYSLFQHEYLGYLFESYVVQVDDLGKLTFQHQNISSKNAREFSSKLEEMDYKLIDLMDSIQQDSIVRHFNTKNYKIEEFFLRTYNEEKGNELLQKEIHGYIERRRAEILELLPGKHVFEMGHDGEPAWKRIDVLTEKATVLFHFRRNDDNTHYFPTIKHSGEKLEFQYKGAVLICSRPAWLYLDDKLYSFQKQVDGNKIMPFLNKRFVVIPKNLEETYYSKFVAPLVESFDVYAKGFEIQSKTYDPKPVLTFSDLQALAPSIGLFKDENDQNGGEPKILFDLSFQYGDFRFKADQLSKVSVSIVKKNDSYVFHRVKRQVRTEKDQIKFLIDSGLNLRHGKVTLPKSEAFTWLNQNKTRLINFGFLIDQTKVNGKKYFLGESRINIEIKENIDWFDIHAVVRFGEFEIPFSEIRAKIIQKQREFKLPNGEIAVIPEAWFTEYSELFSFISENNDNDRHPHTLKKHHLALVKDLEKGELAKVSISRKLNNLRNFKKIEEFELPRNFKGKLRPYQRAGYNWLQFLKSYSFGGCLADDMGLGKTIQTLALLQSEKESGEAGCSLLIMPTSLLYNWEMEAGKFTPELKVLSYSGTNRNKDVSSFEKYDMVLTSYGIARLDIEILKDYYFHYVILDESQLIKNPDSNISNAVKELKSKYKLILTGTPLENTTLDLWSQMSFINPGLLGKKSFFKNEFLTPIEKQNDEYKSKKLFTIIKPFILRRHKSQVAKDLPKKIENVHYSDMTQEQETRYDEVKSFYRNKILDEIETKGLKQSSFLLLQGLTKLRQIANHPYMVDPDYVDGSGKLEDISRMLENAIEQGHKILIFSQFVKHLSIVKNMLDEKGINYAYLDGSSTNRKQIVENFQNNPELKIFLISLKAGGLGLNLTTADYVFILDPWWNPAVEMQAVDRAHRIGQKNTVLTYKFITKNTVEEKILALQQKKIKLATDLISTDESMVKSFTREDIELILS